jgi:hypothetical protein
MTHEELKNFWQQAPVTQTTPMSPDQLRSKALAFQRNNRRVDSKEHRLTLALSIFFGSYVVLWPYWLARLGGLLIILGSLFAQYQLRQRARAADLPGDGLASTLLEFHRRELIRRRNWLRNSWLWYLAPVVPGLLVFSVGMGHGIPGWDPPWLLIALTVASFLGSWLYYLHQANQLQREIDSLTLISNT